MDPNSPQLCSVCGHQRTNLWTTVHCGRKVCTRCICEKGEGQSCFCEENMSCSMYVNLKTPIRCAGFDHGCKFEKESYDQEMLRSHAFKCPYITFYRSNERVLEEIPTTRPPKPPRKPNVLGTRRQPHDTSFKAKGNVLKYNGEESTNDQVSNKISEEDGELNKADILRQRLYELETMMKGFQIRLEVVTSENEYLQRAVAECQKENDDLRKEMEKLRSFGCRNEVSSADAFCKRVQNESLLLSWKDNIAYHISRMERDMMSVPLQFKEKYQKSIELFRQGNISFIGKYPMLLQTLETPYFWIVNSFDDLKQAGTRNPDFHLCSDLISLDGSIIRLLLTVIEPLELVVVMMEVIRSVKPDYKSNFEVSLLNARGTDAASIVFTSDLVTGPLLWLHRQDTGNVTLVSLEQLVVPEETVREVCLNGGHLTIAVRRLQD